MMATCEIINATDSIMQNIVRIVCLLTYLGYFNLKTLESILNYAH